MSRNSDRGDLLDGVLDGVGLSEELPGELFAVVDLLDQQPALRRALTDPGSSDDRRRALVHGLFDNRIGTAAIHLVAEAAVQRWPGGRAFTDAIEHAGVRAQLRVAADHGRLDDVEDELFRFGRTVSSDPDLQSALSDRASGLDRRRRLVADLLDGRAGAETSALAQRAVAARDRSFAATVEDYVTAAAELRDSAVATVRVARPLEADQADRLRRALSAQAGREVTLQVIVDPHVLGGIRVDLGNEVIDGTVESKLSETNRLFG